MLIYLINYFAFSIDAHPETLLCLATGSVGDLVGYHGNLARHARPAVEGAVRVEVLLQPVVDEVGGGQHGKRPLLSGRVETFALALSEAYRELRAVLQFS